MMIPTEPIGSIPRPETLQQGAASFASGMLSARDFEALGAAAVRDTIRDFEAT